jgi:RND family efflux transporter MFP subunit
LADFKTVRVQVAVPELEAPLVTKDQPVKVSVDALPGRTFEGKVTRYAYALDESSKTMLAEIQLPNEKLELRPGMFATVRIGIERKENALLVPADAVVFEKANSSVFKVSESTAHKAFIKVGFNDGNNVEVLTGLMPGDSVILPEKRAINDGQRVRAVEGRK